MEQRRTLARHAGRAPQRIIGVVAVFGVLALICGVSVSLASVAVEQEPQALVASPEVIVPNALPVPEVSAVTPADSICNTAAVTDALAAGDATATIGAAGGAESFRQAVASGTAPCVPLDDPRFEWVVVNKLRPYSPEDYAPDGLSLPASVQSLVGGELRSDAAAALDDLVTGSRDAGAGNMALDSGYRSHQTQVSSYNRQLNARGQDGADLISARPGFSEHQSGLAADVVACDSSCSSIYDFVNTAQGAWVAEHAWEYGWIVRYETDETGITGYQPEPWHLRYVGKELAALYHEGGYHTLEEFFGLPAAPDYAH